MGYKKRQHTGTGSGSTEQESTSTSRSRGEYQLYNLLSAEAARAKARANSDAWHVPESNEDGKSIPVTVRIPPTMATAMQVLMASGKYPYLTQSDLIRSALEIHLIYMFEAVAEIPKTALSAHQIVGQVVRKMSDQKSLDKALAQLDAEIQEALALGNTPEVRRQLSVLIARLDAFPGSHWKDGVLARLKRKYSGVSDQVERAQVGNW